MASSAWAASSVRKTGLNAITSAPRIAAAESAIGVAMGSSRRRLRTSGTGCSGRPTILWPMMPTLRTCRRLGVTESMTVTWLPGTLARRSEETRYCSLPPRVRIISMPSPSDVETSLAPTSCPWTIFGSALRSFLASLRPGTRKLAPSVIGTIQTIAAAIRTGQP